MVTRLDCLDDSYRFDSESAIIALYHSIKGSKDYAPLSAESETVIQSEREVALELPSTLFYPQGGTFDHLHFSVLHFILIPHF